MKNDNSNFKKHLTDSFSKIDDLDIETPNLECFSSLVRDEKSQIEKDNSKQFLLFIACAFVIATISLSLLLYYTEIFMKLHIIALLIPVLFLVIRFILKPKETIK